MVVTYARGVILTVLGCSGSTPGPASAASGYLLAGQDDQVVLDLGNGTFSTLQEHVEPFLVDAILFSHLHPAHCADFSALAVFRRYHPAPPYDPTERRLPVHGP